MSKIWESFAAVCLTLAAAELIDRLCPKNKMVDFVRALAVLALLLSAVLGLTSADWDISRPRREAEERQEELAGYVESELVSTAEEELEQWLQGLLASAGLEAEKILPETDIAEDGSIVLKKVRAVFTYPSDGERAYALLKGTLGETVVVEVETDGR